MTENVQKTSRKIKVPLFHTCDFAWYELRHELPQNFSKYSEELFLISRQRHMLVDFTPFILVPGSI